MNILKLIDSKKELLPPGARLIFATQPTGEIMCSVIFCDGLAMRRLFPADSFQQESDSFVDQYLGEAIDARADFLTRVKDYKPLVPPTDKAITAETSLKELEGTDWMDSMMKGYKR